jgi:hypothetical protein
LLLNALTLELGNTYELPIKFLNPSLALPKLSPGKAVKLWEGKDIAIGNVVAILRELTDGADVGDQRGQNRIDLE